MIANGIIDKDLKILIPTSCESDALQEDKVDFVTPDESYLETLQKALVQNQINAPVVKHTPVITSQKTPSLPINSDKLCEDNANMMATTTFFMNQIYGLKNEIHYSLLLIFLSVKEL